MEIYAGWPWQLVASIEYVIDTSTRWPALMGAK